jgi:hypothetical protein
MCLTERVKAHIKDPILVSSDVTAQSSETFCRRTFEEMVAA